MTASARRAVHMYSNVGIESGVEAADPHKLVLMLFDGAMLAVSDAGRHLAAGSIAAKGESISKAIMIIDNGLKASLDTAAGGELAHRLAALYDYMCRQLLVANAHNSTRELDETQRLLGELRGAWAQIGPAVPAGEKPAASVQPVRFS